MVEISNLNKLDQYLRDKNIVKSDEKITIDVLNGGVSGNVMKVKTADRTMVVKQALEKLKVKDEWLSDPSRIITEKNCLEVYNNIIPKVVPKLYFFDDANFLYGMECAPETSVMWKTDLLAKKLDFNIAVKVIMALLEVHEKTSKDQKVKELFKDKTIFYELRIEPYFETVLKKHPKLAKSIEESIAIAMDQEVCLVHGDFSPKNILVDNKDIFILDFEVAHYGAPAFDLAFFANHFMLKAVKNKCIYEAYLSMLEFMMKIYFDKSKLENLKDLEKDTVNMLAVLFIARVDGKSPAEYIIDESDKQLIRDFSYKVLNDDICTFEEIINLLKAQISTL